MEGRLAMQDWVRDVVELTEEGLRPIQGKLEHFPADEELREVFHYDGCKERYSDLHISIVPRDPEYIFVSVDIFNNSYSFDGSSQTWKDNDWRETFFMRVHNSALAVGMEKDLKTQQE